MALVAFILFRSLSSGLLVLVATVAAPVILRERFTAAVCVLAMVFELPKRAIILPLVATTVVVVTEAPALRLRIRLNGAFPVVLVVLEALAVCLRFLRRIAAATELAVFELPATFDDFRRTGVLVVLRTDAVPGTLRALRRGAPAVVLVVLDVPASGLMITP